MTADIDADYVCPLDKESLEVARKELFEEPVDRLGSVKAFREWIQKQPHIKCDTDTKFLLWFLRGAKFSQLRARELLQNYLAVLTTMPDKFRDIDTHDPNILGYINAGMVLILPKRDRLKRQLVMARPAALHPSNKIVSMKNEMKMNFAVTKFVRLNEITEVHGLVVILDFTGVTMKHMAGRMSADHAKNHMKIFQDSLPGRIKGFHIYNAGTIFDTMFAIAKPFMKKKFLERMHMHSTLESLYKVVPMECLPDEYLPDEYKGPSAGPVKGLIDDLRQTIMDPDYRQFVLHATSEKFFHIDESRKPSSEPQTSFRKINVD